MDKLITKKETFKVKFTSYTHDGLGICKLNGKNKFNDELINFPIFVENALVSEEGIIEIDEVHKSFGKGHLKKLFMDKVSNDRTMPRCPIYEDCGGCHLMHMKYDAQLRFKKQRVIDAFSKIGGFTDFNVLDPLPSFDQYHYRNKVQIPFGFKNNKTICGFYRRNTHEIIPLDECFLQTNDATNIVKYIKNLCNELMIKGYDEDTKDGEIKHVLIKESNANNEIMITIVTKTKTIKNFDLLIQKIIKRYSQVVSIIQNINPNSTNVILGEQNILRYGKPYIVDEILNHKFYIGPMSFFQVNSKTTSLLYSTAIAMGNLKKSDRVIDAYSGIGTIGICLSEKVKEVYQVEIVKEAWELSKENIKLNNVSNIKTFNEDATKQIKKWQEEKLQIDAIIVDPPRKGLDIDLMKSINAMQINKIIYISCDVSTMARDIKHLTSLGYTMGDIQPVDMFPNTLHVETIVCLSRK